MAQGGLRLEQLLKLNSKKVVLLVSLSRIDPYTLKVGDLSRDLAILPLLNYPLLLHTKPYQHLSLPLLHL